MDAVVTMQGVAAGTPADSRKNQQAQKRQWKKFMDSLDPKKLKQKAKDIKQPLKSLAKIKEIPIAGIK
ncbi:MAG: hypothetical protein GWN64_07420 [Candidatus Thorarchaeota archaeon]|nr:hypothetical protein [Candidatus Thorarchaeota archaeon]